MAIEIVRRKFAQEEVGPNRLTKLETRGSGTKTGWKSANEEGGLVTRKRCEWGTGKQEVDSRFDDGDDGDDADSHDVATPS